MSRGVAEQRREEGHGQALERETPLVNARLGKTAARNKSSST
jgi:hypothetical protein